MAENVRRCVKDNYDFIANPDGDGDGRVITAPTPVFMETHAAKPKELDENLAEATAKFNKQKVFVAASESLQLREYPMDFDVPSWNAWASFTPEMKKR